MMYDSIITAQEELEKVEKKTQQLFECPPAGLYHLARPFSDEEVSTSTSNENVANESELCCASTTLLLLALLW